MLVGDVQIGALLDEVVEEFPVFIAHGACNQRQTVPVLDVRIRAVVQEKPDDFHVSVPLILFACQRQRRLAVVVLGIHVRAVLHQVADDRLVFIAVRVRDGHHQGCLAIVVLGVDIRLLDDQQLEDGEFPLPRHHHQRRVAMLILCVQVGAFIDQQLDHVKGPVLRCGHERRLVAIALGIYVCALLQMPGDIGENAVRRGLVQGPILRLAHGRYGAHQHQRNQDTSRIFHVFDLCLSVF